MASGNNGYKKTKCGPQNPSILIRKLVQLMEHPISTYDTKRHLEILNEFLNASHYAFWLHDIPFIIRLYEIIVKKLDSVPEYRKPLKCLLHFSAAPPIMVKSSDRLEYVRDLQEYFTVLGYLILSLHDDNLKTLVLNAIKGLLKPKSPTGCCVDLDFTKQAIEKSELPKILAQLVPVFKQDLSPLLLDVTYLVCEISTISCHKMLEEGMLDYIILRFDPYWRERSAGTKPKNPSTSDKNPLFDDLCCILWKLLNAIDKEKVEVKAPSVFSLWSLHYALRWLNFCEGQKLNRNNLTALILKMLVIFPATNFQESGIFEDIAIIAGAVAGCPCHTTLTFHYDEIDFQYKKIVWACLHKVVDMKDVGEKELMKAFLKYIFHEHPTAKNLVQYCTLIKLLLKLVPKYLSCSLEVFINQDGALNLTKMTERYLLKTFDTELLEAHMYCISEILMAGVDEAVKMFGETGISEIVLSICKKVLEVQTLSADFQKVLARGFCILQILFASGYVTNISIVTLCINYLNRVIQPSANDPLIDTRVTICAIHLLWECIIASKPFYQEFFRQGGIYIMLDMIEASTFPVKSLSLGILADTSEKSSSIPYLITWRKHGIRIIPMLMEIFRIKGEKNCHGIKKIELNEAKSEKDNLITLCHRSESFHIKCTTNVELLRKARCRIHGILYALKVKFKDKVEIANQQYKLFNQKLSTDDELTKLFAENYLSLLMCQSWHDMAKELRKDKIVPVDADNHQIIEKITTIREWKSYLQSEVSRIVDKEVQQEYLNEFTTYTTLKEGRLADALDALAELRYISNSTEKMFQLRKKLRLQQEVEDSTQNLRNTFFHRTICNLPVTNTYNQTISIQSNIIYEKKEEYHLNAPVSSSSSESFESTNNEHPLSEPHLEC